MKSGRGDSINIAFVCVFLRSKDDFKSGLLSPVPFENMNAANPSDLFSGVQISQTGFLVLNAKLYQIRLLGDETELVKACIWDLTLIKRIF